MESRFGHNFSGVRVHTDARAAESARSLASLAYTVGRDLVFASGQYNPATLDGRRLLAHELTHVIQQGASARGESHSLQRQSASKNIPRTPGTPNRPAPRPGTRECEDACHRDYEKCAPLRPNALDPRCWNALQNCLRDCGPGQSPGLPGLRGEPVIQPKLRVHSAGDVYEQEADRVAEQVVSGGDARVAHSLPGGSFGAVGVRPSLQRQSNHEALRTRLSQVRSRLAQLRAQLPRRDDDGDFARGVQSQSLAAVERRERAPADVYALGPSTVARFRRAVNVSRGSGGVTLGVNFQLTYRALTDEQARRQAATDIPRIEAAIRDAWQVNITSGEYAGVAFRIAPTVTLLPSGASRSENSFLIEVRAPRAANRRDLYRDPSATNAIAGTISLNPGHLQGARIVVVAHEVTHLFGFADSYQPTMPRRGGRRMPWSLGRQNAGNRADLLGLIDPLALRRLQREGVALPRDVARQLGPARLWEGEASTLLRVLAVEPPARQHAPRGDDFDPDEETERERREGAARLAPRVAGRRRAEDALRFIQTTDEIVRLEREERQLTEQLSAH